MCIYTSVVLERELSPAESVAWMVRKWHSGPLSRSSREVVLRIPLTLFTENRLVSPATGREGGGREKEGGREEGR